MQHLKELDIDSLNEYARFLLDILTIDPTESSNNLHVNEYRNSFGEIIAHAYSKKCRTDLNSIIRELETPLKYLGSKFVSNVNIELKKRFGIEIPQKKDFQKANKIIDRGYIKTETEYRFLLEYFEMIGGDQSISKHDLRKIAILLDEFNVG